MRQVTATEKYRAVNEGKLAEGEFVRQMRLSYPSVISQWSSFKDTVTILKNRGYITEKSGVDTYDSRVNLNISPNSIDRGVRYELSGQDVDPTTTTDKELVAKITDRVVKNLKKDPLHYINLLSKESNKVDKHDKEVETKRGAKDKDVINGLKKATLKEDSTPKQKDFYADYTDIGMFYMEKHGNIYKGKEQVLSDAQYEDLGKKIVDQLYDGDIAKAYDDLAVPGLDAAAKRLADDGKLINPQKVDGTPVEEEDGYNTDPNLQMHIDDEEWEREMGRGPKEDVVKEAGKAALIQTMNNAISAIKGKYGKISGISGIIRDFLKTHLDDLANGADPLDEFENFVDINYDSLSETEISEEDIDTDGYVESMGPEFDVAVEQLVAAFEDWKSGPMTEPEMIPYAVKDVIGYLQGKLGGTLAEAAGPDPESICPECDGSGCDHCDGTGAHKIREEDYVPKRRGALEERVGGLQEFISLIEDRAAENNTTEAEEAEEVVYAIGDHYNFGVDIMHAPNEAKGKDHDGDGDIDGDDYMAAKDKAIKKAMGKDEAFLKENIKSIITKVLEEEVIVEAATGNLAKYSEEYGGFEGLPNAINQLENIVTDVESYYNKVREKLQKVYNDIGNITNEEGLKVGGFIAPSIESAFLKDLKPVIAKGFTKGLETPKVKTISQADIMSARMEQGLDEKEIEEKQTMFTPVHETKKK